MSAPAGHQVSPAVPGSSPGPVPSLQAFTYSAALRSNAVAPVQPAAGPAAAPAVQPWQWVPTSKKPPAAPVDGPAGSLPAFRFGAEHAQATRQSMAQAAAPMFGSSSTPVAPLAGPAPPAVNPPVHQPSAASQQQPSKALRKRRGTRAGRRVQAQRRAQPPSPPRQQHAHVPMQRPSAQLLPAASAVVAVRAIAQDAMHAVTVLAGACVGMPHGKQQQRSPRRAPSSSSAAASAPLHAPLSHPTGPTSEPAATGTSLRAPTPSPSHEQGPQRMDWVVACRRRRRPASASGSVLTDMPVRVGPPDMRA